MADVCVIGAGPAGSIFAARMAQLGHQVHLIERKRFPRSHLGESLSPGVMTLLTAADMHRDGRGGGFSQSERVSGSNGPTDWDCVRIRASRNACWSTAASSICACWSARGPWAAQVHQPARVLERRLGRREMAADHRRRRRLAGAGCRLSWLTPADGAASRRAVKPGLERPRWRSMAIGAAQALPADAADRGGRGRLVLGRSAARRNLQYAGLCRSRLVPVARRAPICRSDFSG